MGGGRRREWGSSSNAQLSSRGIRIQITRRVVFESSRSGYRSYDVRDSRLPLSLSPFLSRFTVYERSSEHNRRKDIRRFARHLLNATESITKIPFVFIFEATLVGCVPIARLLINPTVVGLGLSRTLAFPVFLF